MAHTPSHDDAASGESAGRPCRIAGLVLAGGASRRMGADKATLTLAGLPMALHVVRALRPQVHAVALSGNTAFHAGLGLPVLEDPAAYSGCGPLAGLLAGMQWAASVGATALVIAPCDTPFLPDDLMARLLAGGLPSHAVSSGRDHPTCALWPVESAGAVEAALSAGERRLLQFAAGQGSVAVAFDGEPDNDPFANVNSPADLAAASARLAAKATETPD